MDGYRILKDFWKWLEPLKTPLHPEIIIQKINFTATSSTLEESSIDYTLNSKWLSILFEFESWIFETWKALPISAIQEALIDLEIKYMDAIPTTRSITTEAASRVFLLAKEEVDCVKALDFLKSELCVGEDYRELLDE